MACNVRRPGRDAVICESSGAGVGVNWAQEMTRRAYLVWTF